MNDNPFAGEWNLGARVMFAAATTVIVIAGIKAAAPIVNLFLISVFVAVISASPVFWLQRKGVPMVLGVVIVITAVVVVTTTMALALGSSFASFSAALPVYQARLEQNLAPLLGWLHNKGVDMSGPSLFPELDPSNILGLVVGLLGNVGSLLSNSLLILLTVIFILLDTAGFQAKLHVISADPKTSFGRFTEFTDNVRHYLAIKTGTSLATGLCVGIWVYLLGLDFPVIWGMLAFFFNYIPNIGSILAAVPAILLALVQLGIPSAVLAALGYLLINFIIGNVLEPRIMGRGVGLAPSVVFLSMIFWGWVLGSVGMILSVPLTISIKIALNSSADTRWLAVLLDSEAAARKPDAAA